MSQDSTVPTSWQSVAAELRAYREKQQATWGDLDHALIGRYLAGEVTPEERDRVEASLDQHPELRVLTEVVSEVMGESVPAVEEPAILSFKSSRKPVFSRFQSNQRRFALAAAACLLLGLGFLLNPNATTDQNPVPAMSDSLVAKRDLFKGTLDGALPETERVARADEWVEKKEYEKAAKLLFANPQPVKSQSVAAPPGTPSTRINHSVAKLTERVLEDMKQTEAQTRAIPDNGTIVAQEYTAYASQMQSYIISQSVPYLVDGLNQKSDAVLRERSATVLKQLGPRARQAEQDLEEMARRDCKFVSPKAREALASVRMPFWVGVQDRARVLNDMSRTRINQRIAELSRKHQVYIVAETVKSLPPEMRKSVAAFKSEDKKHDFFCQYAEKRCQAAAAEKGVYVLICMDPPTVQVTVCSEFKKEQGKGWSKDTVQARMQDSLTKHNLDKGLEEVVEMIEQALAK